MREEALPSFGLGTVRTPARWWDMHKGSFDDWCECRRMMRMCFGKLKVRMIDKYDGKYDPHEHLAKWAKAYGVKPQPECVHLFCQPRMSSR